MAFDGGIDGVVEKIHQHLLQMAGIAVNRGNVRSDLQQVIKNLLNNAIDAAIERHGASGGAIRIESAPSAENRHVEIKVCDNGSGISAENLQKIFTPFFTTKPVGKGTGLGLSVCYGIIQKMNGDMAVASQENVGTTFTIRLPSMKGSTVQDF